jgi:hypothetical protein
VVPVALSIANPGDTVTMPDGTAWELPAGLYAVVSDDTTPGSVVTRSLYRSAADAGAMIHGCSVS